ncbi:magnesium protoporphyrin IX methyltransferase, chloroplastic [Tanacetum coccineum]
MYYVTIFLEAFSRLGAVYDETYMLNKPECKVEFDEEGMVCGVTSEGETSKCKKVVCDPSYLSTKAKELQGKEGLQMPKFEADGMIAHLATLAENRVMLSFTPKTFYYDMLKRIGELFPRPSKATRSYLHSEADIEQA